jgi:hypothetical protein
MKGKAMSDKIKRQVVNIIGRFDLHPCAWIGRPFGDLLQELEDYNLVDIYWGCWTDEELAEVIGS